MSDAPKGPKSAPSLKCFGYNAAVCSVERSCPFVCEGPCEFHRRLESELGSATGCGLPDSVPGYLDADYKYFTYELAKAKKIRIRAEGKWGELLKGMKDGGQRESKGGDRKLRFALTARMSAETGPWETGRLSDRRERPSRRA